MKKLIILFFCFFFSFIFISGCNTKSEEKYKINHEEGCWSAELLFIIEAAESSRFDVSNELWKKCKKKGFTLEARNLIYSNEYIFDNEVFLSQERWDEFLQNK